MTRRPIAQETNSASDVRSHTLKRASARYVIAASIISCLLYPLAWAAAPVKLRLDTPNTSVWTGEEQRVQATLVDADNLPAPAPHDWPVTLTVTDPSGGVSKHTVTIPRGASSQLFPLTPGAAGVWEIGAHDPQLLDGAVVLNARARVSASPAPAGTRAGEGIDLSTILRPSPGSAPQIELRASPRRKLLADGKDNATIYGLLIGQQTAAAQDIELRLHNDDGTLAPAAVRIPKGQFSGTAQLTARHPGTVTVEYLGASPTARIVGESRLQVAFAPPITRVALSVSPPNISFLETADLVVRLLDEGGRPLATDEPRAVFLTIESGSGQIEPATLNFTPGSAEQRARLRPTQAGTVTIAAASPDLLTIRAATEVAWPVFALITSCIGGAIGGGLVFLQQRRAKKWRIAIGLVTGFMLYWAAVFIGLNLIPAAVALNPLSALAISITGGWLGSKVFTPLLQRMGLSG